MPLPRGEAFAGSTPVGAEPRFTPRIALFTEPMIVNVGSDFDPQLEERPLPVLSLDFDYQGTVIRSSERAGLRPRDLGGEQRARQILESFGPLELGCQDILSARLGSRADYIIRSDEDRHALCSFTAYALPQLRRLGFAVSVDQAYPFQVVDGDPPFYAEVDAEAGSKDWFNLELGIEVDGRRVNLLPTLLEILERLPASGRLEDVVPAGARCFALPVGDNRYVTIPPERLQILLKVLRELYLPGESNRQSVRFPALAARALAEMEAAFGQREDGSPRLCWSGAPALRERGQALLCGPPPVAGAPPAGLRAELRPYQRQGLAWLQHLREHDAGGVLADDMGLGKTLQAIAHIVAEKEAGRLDRPTLVVTPTSLVGNWQRELGRFAPYLQVLVLHGPGRHRLWPRLVHADVVLTTYPALLRDGERLEGQQFHLALLDEAQAIKNPRSLAHQAAVKIDARHRICLTGTPVENSLSELWALFEFVNPGLLGDAEWFAHRYTRPIEREGRVERLADLRTQVAPFILRRMKDEVARELPPKTEIVRPVELRGSQRDLYESLRLSAHAEVRQAIAEKGLGASTITILDALMKLRQVCCDPRLLAGEAAREVRESAKYTLLMELITQQLAAGRRLLVFSQFATMLGLIGNGLRDAGIPFAVLTGATTNRQRPIDDFQAGKVGVFLISLKAGGTGLNLTTADTVVHYDPWWNPAAQAQATDRAHRIGQKKPVFVYNLIVAGSVEERMLALQRRKRQLAEGLLGRDPDGALLSAGEVDRLFAPLQDDDREGDPSAGPGDDADVSG
jgi:superfamily II DNA or RNA helicase